MGYESMIIIGEGTNLQTSEGVYFQEAARFDLGKVNIDPALYFTPSNYFFYSYGYDEAINKDYYGQKPSVASVKDTIAWLKSTKNKYLIMIAKTIEAISKHLENPLILHCGC